MSENIEGTKEKKESKEYELQRDGMRPLSFGGIELGSVSDYYRDGKDQTRWDEYTLYRTRAGKYVLGHVYHTQWQGEASRSEASIHDSAQDALMSAAFDDPDEEDEEEILPNLIAELAKECDIDISEKID